MATVIRLKRGGRTHAPAYRLVVMDSRTRPRGPELDTIGYYHPCAHPEAVIEVDTAKAINWLGKGARTSDTVHDLFTKKGIFVQFAAKASESAVAAVEVEAAPKPEAAVESAEATE